MTADDAQQMLDQSLHSLRNAMASVDIARSLLARTDDPDRREPLADMLSDAADQMQHHARHVADLAVTLVAGDPNDHVM